MLNEIDTLWVLSQLYPTPPDTAPVARGIRLKIALRRLLRAMEHEQWRPVPEYEGLYEASTAGRVRSVDRTIIDSNGNRKRYKGRVLSPSLCRNGYPRVNLSKCGIFKRIKVHRIVACTFLGEPPDGLYVCHWDDVKTNNHVSNLRYATPAENTQDAIRNGAWWR